MIESRGEHRAVHLNVQAAIKAVNEAEMAAVYAEELADEAGSLSDRSMALSTEATALFQKEGKSAKSLALAYEAKGLAIAAKSLADEVTLSMRDSQRFWFEAKECLNIIDVHVGRAEPLNTESVMAGEVAPAWNGHGDC